MSSFALFKSNSFSRRDILIKTDFHGLFYILLIVQFERQAGYTQMLIEVFGTALQKN